MRTALALATAAAASLIGLGTAAPASAATCEAHSPGLTISHVEMHEGLSCDHAKQVIHHALRGNERAIGWTCHHYGSHHIPYSCWTSHSGHWLTFFVVVGDGTGPGGF